MEKTLTGRTVNWFFYSSGALLGFTGMAKCISSLGHAGMLDAKDPLFRISFRYLFQLAGTGEVVGALICFANARLRLRAQLIAWIATNLLVYRGALLWIGYDRPCNCLGNLTDSHPSPCTHCRYWAATSLALYAGW